MHEKADRGVRLNANDFRRGAGCAAHHKILRQLTLIVSPKIVTQELNSGVKAYQEMNRPISPCWPETVQAP